jgi:hypothetical protein
VPPIRRLDLNDKQKEKIDELRVKMNEQMNMLQKQLDVKRAELRVLWTANRPNRKEILAKQDEMDVLRKQERETRIDFCFGTLSVLNPKQKQELCMYPKWWKMRYYDHACSHGHHGYGWDYGVPSHKHHEYRHDWNYNDDSCGHRPCRSMRGYGQGW